MLKLCFLVLIHTSSIDSAEKSTANAHFTMVMNHQNMPALKPIKINHAQHATNVVSSLLASTIFFYGGKYFYDKETETINNPSTTKPKNLKIYHNAKITSYALSGSFSVLAVYQGFKWVSATKKKRS